MCAWKGLARLPCLKHFSIQIRRPCTSKIGSNACNTSVISWNMISTLIYCLQYFWTLLFGFFEPLSRNARNNCILCITMHYAIWKSMKLEKFYFFLGHKPRDGKPSASIGHRSLCCFRIFQVRAWRDKNVQFRTIGLGLGWCAWVSDVGMVRSSVFLSPSSTPEAFENSWIISAAK